MNDRRYKCPEEYADEAATLEAAGDLKGAARAYEMAPGASLGRMRAMRYQEAADRLYERLETPTRAQLESKLRAARAAPGYVPEFPPSRLIDDSVRGCAGAVAALRRGLK